MTEMASTGFRASKPNLVIVRAGARSLHVNWLEQDHASRSWDLLVSYYDRAAFDAHVEQPGIAAHFQLGGKWDGIYKTVMAVGGNIEKYEYIWLPDDDIDSTGLVINQLFTLMKTSDLAVAQPALTHDSYFTHFIFSQCPKFRLRYSNYIEIMVPCLKYSVFEAMLPEFSATMSGFGLDYIWCRLPQAGPLKSAIIDEIAVHHTRPVGVHLRSNMNQKGVVPKDEEALLCAKYGIKSRITPIIYGAIFSDGNKIFGRKRLGFIMAFAYLTRLFTYTDKILALRKVIQLVRRQMTKPLDMSTLS